MMRDNLPLVSIIAPAYNEERNIDRYLRSIKGQTYPKIEIIVVDDGSTDKTVEIAKRIPVKVYERRHAERSIQRNFGAKKSTGGLLIFLDVDMELTPRVVRDCIETCRKGEYAAIVIPEKTAGVNLLARIRQFEREMYMGDLTIEVARVFKREVFFEFDGYDPKLTGPEDYDLPFRISKKYKIGRSKEYLWHHEENLTLARLLKKRFYYASRGAHYARKHPELIASQGNLLFRKAFFANWRKFLGRPFLGFAFIFVKTLEQISAVMGFIHTVGWVQFIKTLPKLFK